MRILTLGDSWTFGSESSDPARMSWPAQMAAKYHVDVVNLGRGGSSNQRAVRIGIEELCRDCGYDWVILPLGPGSRTEILKVGKWHQIWPGLGRTEIDKIYTDFWHPWNDIQQVILMMIQFISTVERLGPKLFVTGLSFRPNDYRTQMRWILDYKNDNNFESLGMPLADLDIDIKDLDRKLRSLKAIHDEISKTQPEYFVDVVEDYLMTDTTKTIYGPNLFSSGQHPNDQGYLALADYFAAKIGLV